eukprot:Gb_31557 [translate_table: standard]
MEKVCLNRKCGAATTSRWRAGWILRSGRMADLCDSCGSEYEQMRFCETFHSDEEGWKNCNTCKKLVHCGCIASLYSFILLDAGGIECINCAKKNDNPTSVSNQNQQTAPFLIPSERLQDLPLKFWMDSMGARVSFGNTGTEHLRQVPNPWQALAGQIEVSSCRQTPEMGKLNAIELIENNAGERFSASRLNRIDGDAHKGKTSEHLKLDALEDSGESHAISEAVEDVNESESGREGSVQRIFSREEGFIEGLPESRRQTREVYAEQEIIKSSTEETKVSEEPTMACFNISLGYSTSKDVNEMRNNKCAPTFGLAISSGSPEDTKEENKFPAAYPQHQRQRQILPKPSHASPSTGSDSSKDMHPQIRVARPPGEGRGRNQLLPRYWPRSTDQELQLISGDSNSRITPLFEKMLSASDAGRIGRLVLPKACAEAYFPSISQPEGVPLTVQDAKGKDWVFQFRYWPNNNSRMYVLEGVTPCIQSMQLQAGDTVTFSRLDLEGKLVMGFRKASNPASAQEGQPSTSAIGASISGGLNSGCVEKFSGLPFPSMNGNAESHMDTLTDKKRSRSICAKNKRLRIDNDDAFELKMTWEEAQDLLHPPPRAVPSIVMIEGHEFEEYEEPPILGKRTIFTVKQSGEQDQWAECDGCGSWRRLPLDAVLPRRWTCANNTWDSKRASCSAPPEISLVEFEDLLQFNRVLKKQEASQGRKGLDTSCGLDALANAVALDENATAPPLIAQTTKHPRHRPGCTCIVCIQPPSGKGPKHKPTCTCNVCLTVKRRFKTLMMRRKKRQSEREAENARKKRTSAKDEGEVSSVSKGRSDLYPLPENGLRQGNPSLEIRDEITAGNGITLPTDLNSQASYKGTRGGKEEGSVSKGQIDLNSHPEREEEPSGVAGRGSMLRLLQDANLPLDMYLKQQGFAGLICPPLVSMPTVGFQNNPSEQRADEHSCILPAVQNSEYTKEEHLFLPKRINSDTAPVSFQVSHQGI